MKYSAKEILQYVQEEDVKFVHLAFHDIFGKQKNLSIMPGELRRATNIAARSCAHRTPPPIPIWPLLC